jgi:DNA replication protein DnaC
VFAGFDLNLPLFAKAHAAVREWAYAATRPGDEYALVLWSEESMVSGVVYGYGSGKTMLAKAAYAYLLTYRDGRNRPVYPATFLKADDFLGAIKDLYATDKPEFPLFNQWGHTAVLLDDVGKEYVSDKSTEWATEKYYRLIDRLYENKKPLLVTTNLPPERLQLKLGGAVWSRLLEMCRGTAGFVNLSGVPDFRLRKAGLT